MSEWLFELDKNLFFSLNGSLLALDSFWIFWSSGAAWVVMALPIVWMGLCRLHLSLFLGALVGAAILLTFTDQVSNLVKDLVQRPRPCRIWETEVHLLWPRCSEFGFFSAHAANSFAQATWWTFISSQYLANRISCIIGVYCYLAASCVSLSRIFVGVHFPSDVLAGLIFGTLTAFLAAKGFAALKYKFGRSSPL
ncbi:MAG: phosphatase PAP2 family protein [Flavobacteriales bacterium]|nr:phosphatase PAP2 family protein [Flavobacteriales bacterium]MCX7768509.1 phosphatase PAP2 family protein [Flavobacteriales bacterium]MDW8409841.1 phosphatase PAP2 family protein [Flavobacteriales bacterium]